MSAIDLLKLEHSSPDLPMFGFASMHQAINAQKASSLFVIFGMMVYFNNYGYGPFVYLALHGSYGIMWSLKYYVFPDKTFHRKVGFLFWWFGMSSFFSYINNNNN
jgi:hypothetical protein